MYNLNFGFYLISSGLPREIGPIGSISTFPNGPNAFFLFEKLIIYRNWGKLLKKFLYSGPK
jgi:hypothetical protein